VVGIFFKRYSLMAMGFATTSLGQNAGIYAPSLVEVGIAGGLLAFGALIMTLGAKVLPLRVPEDEHGHGEGSLDAASVGELPAAAPAPGLVAAVEPALAVETEAAR
jgi:Ni/Fe-hydrogenase subunit HybB-like protein